MPSEPAGVPQLPIDDDDSEPDEICFECGGEGYILDDCFEDTCCCADPEQEHGYIRCQNCGGSGA